MSTNNGTVTQRKSLSSQLDRLDSILDCLGDGLNEAVRDAVQQAVGEAARVAVQETLQGVLKEVLSNPELLQTFRAVLAPTPSPATQPQQHEVPNTEPYTSPSWLTTFWAWLLPMLCSKWVFVKVAADTVCGWIKSLWGHRWSVLSVSSVSVCIGCGSFLMGPVWSAIFAGLGGASLTVLVVAALALRRVFDFSSLSEEIA